MRSSSTSRKAVDLDAAPDHHLGRGFVMMPELRNNTRVILDDVPCAAALWERLAPAIPARIGGASVAVGLNERLRFYRYGPGEFFAVAAYATARSTGPSGEQSPGHA